MRVGAATFIWTSPFTTAQLPLVSRLKAHGFDVIEVAYEIPGAVDLTLLANELAATGMEASILAFCTPDRDVSAESTEVRTAGVNYLRSAVDLAVAVGATIVGGPIAHPPGRARSIPPAARHDERQRAIESLHAVAEYAASGGVGLAVEQLSRYDSDMFNRASETLRFVDEVDHPAVGILLDTFHTHIEEDSTEKAIKQIGDRLFHFHAAENNRGIPGQGQVNWAEAATALREIGYTGAVSVESFAYQPDLAGLVSMWHPWFDDPDVFAREALSFVRAAFV